MHSAKQVPAGQPSPQTDAEEEPKAAAEEAEQHITEAKEEKVTNIHTNCM